MVTFSSLAIMAAAATGVIAVPFIGPSAPLPQLGDAVRHDTRALATATGTGTDHGFFYSFWTDGGGQVTYDNLEAGRYKVKWNGTSGNFVAGKGWNPGSAKTVVYNGTWSTPGNGYLSLYGWTTDPLVEYYIVENFGNFNPSTGGTAKGSIDSDGGTYDIFLNNRVNQPSIQGTKTFKQYWSVRRTKRTGGTVNTGNHFAAWSGKAGLTLGKHDYMILATEGYHSSGQADITVGEASTSSTGH